MKLQAIYLASASPRRSALLRQIFVPHQILIPNVDESRLPAESPVDYVVRLARAKAQRIWSRLKPEEIKPVLAADTTVALGEEIFGKPEDRTEGMTMLQRLAGRTHQVYTAWHWRTPAGWSMRSASVMSRSGRCQPPNVRLTGTAASHRTRPAVISPATRKLLLSGAASTPISRSFSRSIPSATSPATASSAT